MAKYQLPDFQPDLRVVARGTASNRLMVLFDTATDADRKRTPRLVTINTEGVKSIMPSVEDLIVAETVGDKQLVTGKIYLLAEGGSDPAKYLLSDFALELLSSGRPNKEGAFPFPPLSEIDQALRQGVADAFSDASLYLLSSPAEPSQAVVQGVSPWSGMMPAPAFAHHGRASDAATPSQRKRMLTLMIGIPLLVMALVWGVFKIITPRDPVQAAVAQALATDPRARDEQIEITRATLREMGLDPGKSGDLGCLAPPQ